MLRLLIPLGVLVAGCKASRPIPAQSVPPLAAVALADRPAAALVFTPPITLGTPTLDLSRSGREPEAFWGYSQGETESYDVETDDMQYTDPFTGGYRESYNERSGTLVR